MKTKIYINITVLGLILFLVCSQPSSEGYRIQPIPFTQVHINDSFWKPRMETNRTVTIPHAFKKCEENGRLDNFALAGGLAPGKHQGIYPFDDTDVYKILEGASYALMLQKDSRLEAYLDSVITLIQAAQEEDGYLYTVRTNQAEHLKNWYGDTRWGNLSRSHELYNAGHLFEAAAAHYQATGKRNLLEVAVKFADLIDRCFGADSLQKPPGHQVIEMGLVKLFRVTGEQKYLDLAKFFLDVRGKPLDGRELWGEYSQDHKPVTEQEEAVGHAVRAGYMYAGMADVATLTGDHSYVTAIDRLWQNVAGKKLYLTGGIGQQGANEGFAGNYEIPNMSAYNETCASIANIYWNHRLFLLHGDAKYIDIMERTLYNALLSGVSLDGKHFFYPNPLASVGQHQRQEWFGCACCPGNVTRFMASIPGYMYAVQDDKLYINLYASGTAEVKINGKQVQVMQKTDYPWDGRIHLQIKPENPVSRFSMYLRIPGWARGEPLATDLYRFMNSDTEDIQLIVNGSVRKIKIKKGYIRIDQEWYQDDEIILNLPMTVRRVFAHDKVEADRHRVALQRGPVVFCVEWPDVKDGHVHNLLLPDDAKFTVQFRQDLLDGIQTIKSEAVGFYEDDEGIRTVRKPFTAIPYYGWAHRGPGEMAVWLARDTSAVKPVGRPTLASKSTVSASFGKNPQSVNDQLVPESSGDQEVPYFHCWPHRGTTEWIQYDFPHLAEISMVDVYWFDDTGRGECRVPESWRILYKTDGDWRPVYTEDEYGTEKDRFNRVIFETVKTDAIRLEIKSQPEFAGGIHEWRVK